MKAVILTALNVEYSAVREHLCDLEKRQYKGTYYEVGNFSDNSRTWNVAIATIGPHNETASRETERAIEHFKPQVALFVGVAGGLKPEPKPDDAVVGDVIAATKVYGYESGKADSEFLTRPELYRSTHELVQCALSVARDNTWIKRIKPNIFHSKPKAIVAPIAAGPKVLTSTKSVFYKFIRSNYNDAQAVEMEGLGFLSAAHANQGVKALVIRGISDLIDGKDNADSGGSQDLASKHAAAFAFEVLANLSFEQTALDLPERGKIPDPENPPIGSRLPFYRNAIFTGRKDELLWIADVLVHSAKKCGGKTQTPATITGFGGKGKTQLAIEFCYRYGRFFQGVHWIHADQDIPAEIVACGSSMNLPKWPDKYSDQLSFTLKFFQDGSPRLVVLDNVEDSSVLQDWMPRLPYCSLLLTSKMVEWPLDLGLRIWPLDTLPRSDSKKLLCMLAPRLEKVLDKDLDDIAYRLGDLPLALDLAGRYLKARPGLSPEKYLMALEEAGNALEHTSLKDHVKHSPTKHTTSLAATFSLSWDLLGENEVDQLSKHIFIACGYCAHNVPIPLTLLKIAFSSDELVDRAISRLSGIGLIIPTDSGPSLHPLLAEYARSRDETNDELTNLINALSHLAAWATNTGNVEYMRPLREHLKTVAAFAESIGSQKAGLLWNELGSHFLADAEYINAKIYSARSLKIDAQLFGSNHPTVAKRFNNLGVNLRYLGNSLSAKKCHQKAVKIEKENNGPNSQQLAQYLNNLGGDLEDLGDLSEAKKYILEAIKILEATNGFTDPQMAAFASNLGRVQANMGDLLGAKRCLIRALKIDIKAHEPNHPLVAKRLNNLATILIHLHYPLGAKKCLLRALEISKLAYGPEHHEVGLILLNLGEVMKILGDEEAKRTIDMGMKILKKRYGNEFKIMERRNRRPFSVL